MNATLLDYQAQAGETAGPYVRAVDGLISKTSFGSQARVLRLMYVALGLAGEAGEFANKVKKVLRDHAAEVDSNEGLAASPKGQEVIAALTKELGGVLWYVAQSCTELGIPLSEVARVNLEQLRDRAQRGALQGSGDDR
jgi:NTP pyrophosphatase (non-canonical NTP hydrolase)